MRLVDLMKKIAKLLIPLKYRASVLRVIRMRFLKDEKCAEKKHYGNKNPKQTFYVIRYYHEYGGVGCLWRIAIGQMLYAVERGYIPVVDYKNYYARSLQDEERKGLDNAWNYYFKQEISLEEVYQSKNVILGWQEFMAETPLYKIPVEMDLLQKWNKIIQKYLQFSDVIKELADKLERKYVFKNDKVLGVVVRREFEYGNLLKKPLYNEHPQQADLSNIINDIRKKMKEWKCNKVFLSVDDCEALELLKENFGEDCFYLERPRWHYFENGKPNLKGMTSISRDCNREEAIYKRNVEYLTEIIILSKCNCLLAGMSGGTLMSYILNNGKYEEMKIYDLGMCKI